MRPHTPNTTAKPIPETTTLMAQDGIPAGQQVTATESINDFPEAPPPGSLGALKAYLTKDVVISRLQMLCGTNKDEARRILSNLQEMVETSEDPDNILKCSPRSIVNCAVQATKLNLPVDSRKLAFIVPYKSDKRQEHVATLMPSYHGFEYAIRRHYPDYESRTEFKFKEDHFKVIRNGHNETFEHTPANPFRADYQNAEGIFYYFTYTDKTGERFSAVFTLPMSEVNKIKSGAKSAKFWGPWFRQMALKTVVRAATSTRFKTIVHELVELDNTHFDMDGTPEQRATVHKVSSIQSIVDRQKGIQQQEAAADVAAEQSREDVAPAEADVAVKDEQSLPEKNAPSDAEIRNEQPAAEEEKVHDGEILAPEAKAEPESLWDGKTLWLSSERFVTRQWLSCGKAASFLLNSLGMQSPETKKALLELNKHLLDLVKEVEPALYENVIAVINGEDNAAGPKS